MVKFNSILARIFVTGEISAMEFCDYSEEKIKSVISDYSEYGEAYCEVIETFKQKHGIEEFISSNQIFMSGVIASIDFLKADIDRYDTLVQFMFEKFGNARDFPLSKRIEAIRDKYSF